MVNLSVAAPYITCMLAPYILRHTRRTLGASWLLGFHGMPPYGPLCLPRTASEGGRTYPSICQRMGLGSSSRVVVAGDGGLNCGEGSDSDSATNPEASQAAMGMNEWSFDISSGWSCVEAFRFKVSLDAILAEGRMLACGYIWKGENELCLDDRLVRSYASILFTWVRMSTVYD